MEAFGQDYKVVRIEGAKVLPVINIEQPDRFSCGIASALSIYYPNEENPKVLNQASNALRGRDKLFIYEEGSELKYEDSLWLAIFVKEIFSGYEKNSIVKKMRSSRCDVVLYDTKESIEEKYNKSMIRNGKLLDPTDLENLYKKASGLGVDFAGKLLNLEELHKKIDEGYYAIVNTGAHWIVVYGYFTAVYSDGKKVELPIIMDPSTYFENTSLTNKAFRDYLTLHPLVSMIERKAEVPAILVKVDGTEPKNLIVNPAAMK